METRKCDGSMYFDLWKQLCYPSLYYCVCKLGLPSLIEASYLEAALDCHLSKVLDEIGKAILLLFKFFENYVRRFFAHESVD